MSTFHRMALAVVQGTLEAVPTVLVMIGYVLLCFDSTFSTRRIIGSAILFTFSVFGAFWIRDALIVPLRWKSPDVYGTKEKPK